MGRAIGKREQEASGRAWRVASPRDPEIGAQVIDTAIRRAGSERGLKPNQ
jgi:hypothetical protein